MLPLDIPPFDVLAGSGEPYKGFGSVLRGPELDARLGTVSDEARQRVAKTFDTVVGTNRGAVVTLDSLLEEMWRTGWDPEHGDVNLFARDFGSLLILLIYRELGGEYLFRSVTDLSHTSLWWEHVRIEAFPFHKVLKALLHSKGESLIFFYDTLKGKIRSPDRK